MAGGEILLAENVLIFDDMIDEALEYFVVTLSFQNFDNVPPLASIESNGGDIIRIDIVDNDGELKPIIIRVKIYQYLVHRYLYWIRPTKYNIIIWR